MAQTIYVGVIGYSLQSFDVKEAYKHLKEAFDWIQMEKYPPGTKFVIVSGYTNLGIPALAYGEAVRRGWKTFGIACSKATDYPLFPCNKVKIVGNEWGQESPTFLEMCHIFVRVGGGGQSHREAEQAKTDGKDVIAYELAAL